MKELSIAAKTAKAIREELKQVFPEIKFSVKSETYSMGTAVTITYEDGPTREQVYEVVNKYQYGHFNGMNDCYEMTNKRNDIPQVKYVVISCRRMSSGVENEIIEYLRLTIPACKNKNRDDFVEELNKDMRELIRNEFAKTSYYEPNQTV